MSEEGKEACPEAGIGRLALPPDPVLFGLLYRSQFLADVQDVLPWLLRIDAAHVVMLERQGILERGCRSPESQPSLDEAEVGRVLDPRAYALAAWYGGGPSPEAVPAQLDSLEGGLGDLKERVAVRRRRLKEARRCMAEAVEALVQP